VAALPFLAVGPDGGEPLAFSGTTIVVRASADSTGGAFTIFEETPPMLDTPAHVHAREDEVLYVLEGEHLFTCGDEERRLGPGGLVFLPRGVPHAHRRVVPGVGRLLGMTSPAGFEGFFRVLAEAARTGEPVDDAFARASSEYGITWVGRDDPLG
jgi:mannose-6-phosphate isomerase-like protein (cupin superfamily)